MDDQNNPEEPPTNAAEGEEIVPATQFSQEDEQENEESSPPQNLEEGAPTEHQETPNNPRIFATPGKPPNQRDNLEDLDNMDEEEMVAETPHFNRNQQGKLINYLLCYANIIIN